MTGQRRVLTDDLLAAALQHRAGSPDGYLLSTILGTTEAMPQRRGLGGLVSQRWILFGVGLLLLVAILAAAIVAGGGRLPMPTVPMARYHHNGTILILSAGNPVEIDPAATAIASDSALHLPTTYPADIPLLGMSWAPDGMQLALAAPQNVQLLDVRDGTWANLVACGSGGCAVAWSPDGSTLAIARMGHIDFVQLGERGPVPVDSVSTAGPGTPSWYPDGQRVRFFRGDAAWAIDRDGTNLLKLPGTGTTETAWSPDGSTVAWISHAPWSDTAGTNLTLKIGPADTASAEVSIDIGTCYCLGWAPGLAWSPDGTMVTFSSLGGGTLSLADGLYVVHRDGTGLQRVGPSGWGAPAWRPIP